jgi:hypothetical protein
VVQFAQPRPARLGPADHSREPLSRPEIATEGRLSGLLNKKMMLRELWHAACILPLVSITGRSVIQITSVPDS